MNVAYLDVGLFIEKGRNCKLPWPWTQAGLQGNFFFFLSLNFSTRSVNKTAEKMLIGLVPWSTARSPASRKRSYGKEQVLGTRGTCTQKAHLTSPHQDFSLVPLRSVNDPV